MELQITKEQGEELTKLNARFTRSQKRYFRDLSRIVPELQRYPGYHGEIVFRWVGKVTEIMGISGGREWLTGKDA